MPTPDKPRQIGGYRREETEQVEQACLTLAVTLGALLGQLCIVGGLVPSLLIDQQIGGDPESEEGHCGTNDLDVGLAVALLDDQQYSEISRRLRQEGFEPDVNDRGNPTPQRAKKARSATQTRNVRQAELTYDHPRSLQTSRRYRTASPSALGGQRSDGRLVGRDLLLLLLAKGWNSHEAPQTGQSRGLGPRVGMHGDVGVLRFRR
jgi:hypothetical protein